MRKYQEYEFFKDARKLVPLIYKLTSSDEPYIDELVSSNVRCFPISEKFGLISQIRRASVSILSNIAEGAAKSSEKDFKRFLEMSLGSCHEVMVQIDLSRELGFIASSHARHILSELGAIGRRINAFIKVLSK